MRITVTDAAGASGRRTSSGIVVLPGKEVDVPDEEGRMLCSGPYFKEGKGAAAKAPPKAPPKAKGVKSDG